MKKKRIIKLTLFMIAFVFFINIFGLYFMDYRSGLDIKIMFDIKSDKADIIQVFYKNNEKESWREENSIKLEYNNVNNFQSMEFSIPKDTIMVRVDLGNDKGKIELQQLSLEYGKMILINRLDELDGYNQMNLSKINDSNYEIYSIGKDPYFELNIDTFKIEALNQAEKTHNLVRIILSIITAFMISISFYFIKDTLRYIKNTYKTRSTILRLAKNDFKTKYVSSYLGTIWGFIQPLVMIGTYWFVFQVGFRSTDVGDVPFILWFICGIVPWFFFSEALGSATNCLLEYSYLVKKVLFKIECLPVVKVLSALFVHLFFIGFMFTVYILYGFDINIYNIQVLYYLVCTIVLVLSLGILTSSIVLFFRDLTQIIMIILNVGFWFTPIGWMYTMVSDKWIILFKLNPMYYIVQGYRDTFVDSIWFFQRPYQTLYFWVFVMMVMFIAVKLFTKLKVHFADVL